MQSLEDFWSDPVILFQHSYNPADTATYLSLQSKKGKTELSSVASKLTRGKKEQKQKKNKKKEKRSNPAPLPQKQQQNQL